eukprot:1680820-Pleurochrysis_carterae.AAC.1
MRCNSFDHNQNARILKQISIAIIKRAYGCMAYFSMRGVCAHEACACTRLQIVRVQGVQGV